MKSFRMVLCLGALLLSIRSFATTYYACSGGTWNGASSTLVVYTNSSCSTGATNINSVSWVTGDVLVIQSGVTIVVSNNQAIGTNSGPDITIDLFGSLLFATGSNPGKISLSTNSTIKLETTSTIGCTADGGASTTTCSSSDQVNIGTFKYAGTDINNANSATKPASMTSGGTLPVTLLFFKGSSDSNEVSLSWSTASEINFNYFSLQRSGDGKLFNEIAQIKGHGTTNEIHNYSYNDEFPIVGRSYYQLTSVDFDNYQETFRVISVPYQGDKKFFVSPNPSDGATVNLSFNFDNASEGTVSIYDNLGVLIGTYEASDNKAISFENPLKSGLYLAKYSSTSFTKTERFLVR